MPEDGVDRAIAAWRRSGSTAFERLAAQGLNQFQAGNYDEAERWLAALLEMEAPVHYSDTARFLLARIKHERGETDVAVAQYAAVLKTAEAQGLLGVDVTEVYLHLGLGLAELEEWEEALDYLDKAMRNEALMGIASRASARLLFESLGEQEDAVQLLERAYELQISDRTQTEILLANYLRQVGDYGRAVEVLNTALLRNDRLVGAYGQLHAVYIESGDYGESRDVALGCIDTRPEVSYCWMLAGISYLRLDQPKKAEEYFLEAVELQPTYKTWQYLAETYYALGDNQRARWAERMAESVRP